VLCENGHSDLAFKLLSSKKENTFYNMKKHGATTLWENWNGEASHSHPMFGAVVEYIVKFFNEN
jgi:alpha-L-rhamnosidase